MSLAISMNRQCQDKFGCKRAATHAVPERRSINGHSRESLYMCRDHALADERDWREYVMDMGRD